MDLVEAVSVFVSGVFSDRMANVFSLICSLLVSLSLAPMLASKLLKPPTQSLRDLPAWTERLAAASQTFFDSLDRGYGNLIRWVLSHRLTTVGVSVAILGASLLLLPWCHWPWASAREPTPRLPWRGRWSGDSPGRH